MTAHPRELVRASAGTGKTFRISSRIIGLLAAGEAPRAILASTFTRKAAGEILERVLVRLARAAMDKKAAAELAEHAIADPAAQSSCDPRFWRGVLHRTVRELHRLDLGTLDAFFIRAARTFGHELGLPPRWGIADPPVADRLKAEALQEVLGELDDGARVELVRGLAGGGVRRSVHDALLDELDAILRAHRALDASAGLAAAPGWGALRESAAACPDDLPEQCHDLADRLAREPVPLKKDGEPSGRWQSAVETCVDALRERDWASLLKGSLVRNAIDDPEKGYYSKPIPDGLTELLRQAALLARHDLARDYALRAAAMGRLAALYARAYEERLRDAGALRFDDVTRILAGDDPVGGRADLFYRLDGDTRHLLLDEFQDTSLVQWTALEPLTDALLAAAEAVASGEGAGALGAEDVADAAGVRDPADAVAQMGLPGLGAPHPEPGSDSTPASDPRPSPSGAAVIVADPKQSIYGWRGAAPVVVEHVGDRYRLADASLDVSWRSSQVVLDAVNAIFRDVDSRWVFEGSDVDREIARDWGRAFADHEAARDFPGHLRVEVGPRDPGRGSDRPLLMDHVADRVAALHRKAPGRSIGVLTRKNDTVARLILELRGRGVDASEEGGTALTDSAAVASVLALLRLADHPGDTLAAYHVARTPVGEAVGLTDPPGSDRAERAERAERAAERVSADLRRRLVNDGYGPTLADLAERLGPACDARERVRLRQLTEVGYRHDESPGPRVDDFVRLAEATRMESPGGGSVRVMTVHKAKGLEFDTVVLPELDGSMTGGGSDTKPLTRRPGGTGRATHVFPYMGDDVRRVFGDLPELQEAWIQARAGEVRDALSVLYVAVTRARHALHIIIRADGEKGPGKTKSHARLVREALAPETLEKGERIDDGQVLHERGDHAWHQQLDDTPRSPREPAAAVVAPDEIPLRSGARTRGFERRSPSGMEGGPALDLRRVLGIGTDRGALDRGTLVHAWLEELEWIDDGLPDRARLRAIARREAPAMDARALDDLIDWLEERLTADEVRAALSRDRYPGEAAVEAELPFLRQDGDALMEGTIDRVVLEREGGEVVRAEILDYKTDAVEPGGQAALAERVEHYAPQLRAYARAVAEMYSLKLGDVKAALVFVGIGRVVKVDVS